jgi:hypothetical protein
MGDFTNWQPRAFMEIVEQIERMEPKINDEELIDWMHLDSVLPFRKTSTDMMNPTELCTYKKYICDFYEDNAPNNWKHVLPKHLLYKKPHLVFGTGTRPDFCRKLFYAAAMFKVGKHEFIVRAPKQVYDRKTFEWVDSPQTAPQYTYFTNVSDIRVEDVHPCKYLSKLLILLHFSHQIGSHVTERKEVQQGEQCVRSLESGFRKDAAASFRDRHRPHQAEEVDQGPRRCKSH